MKLRVKEVVSGAPRFRGESHDRIIALFGANSVVAFLSRLSRKRRASKAFYIFLRLTLHLPKFKIRLFVVPNVFVFLASSCVAFSARACPTSQHSGVRDQLRVRPTTHPLPTHDVVRCNVRTRIVPPSRGRLASQLQLPGLRVQRQRIFLRGFRRDVRRGCQGVLAVPQLRAAHADQRIVGWHAWYAGCACAV